MYTIYLTTECNFRCTYCYEDYFKHLNLNEKMLIEILNFIFDHNLKEKIIINFMGGEPLIMKELIYEAIKYIKNKFPERNVIYYLTTNASLLDDEFITFMKNNRFKVRLSFDGCKESHNINRVHKDGNLTYDWIFDNVRKVRDHKIDYSVRMTITINNIEYLFKNIVFLHENGLDNISLIPDVLMKMNEEKCKELWNQMYKVTRYYIEECDSGRKFMIDQIDGNILQTICNFGNNFSMCDAGIYSFKIMPDGKIYPCGFVTNDDNFKIGDIWEGVDIAQVKKLTSSLYDSNGLKCKECLIKDFCHGMKCGYMNYLMTGKINIPSDAICQCEKIFYEFVTEILEYYKSYNIEKLKKLLGKYYEYVYSQKLGLSKIGKELEQEVFKI